MVPRLRGAGILGARCPVTRERATAGLAARCWGTARCSAPPWSAPALERGSGSPGTAPAAGGRGDPHVRPHGVAVDDRSRTVGAAAADGIGIDDALGHRGRCGREGPAGGERQRIQVFMSVIFCGDRPTSNARGPQCDVAPQDRESAQRSRGFSASVTLEPGARSSDDAPGSSEGDSRQPTCRARNPRLYGKLITTTIARGARGEWSLRGRRP